MKIVTIVGARPQFIKAAAVSRAISRHNQEASKARIEYSKLPLQRSPNCRAAEMIVEILAEKFKGS